MSITRHASNDGPIFCNADRLSCEDVKRIFPDPGIGDAAGVLEMVSKSPEEHRLYDLRRKFQRDEATRIEVAQRDLEAARAEALREGLEQGIREGIPEGETKGTQKGVLLGRVALLQELLGISQPAPDELSNFDAVELSELADVLQTQLRNRSAPNPEA